MEDRRTHSVAKALLTASGVAGLLLAGTSLSFAGTPMGAKCSGAGLFVQCTADSDHTVGGRSSGKGGKTSGGKHGASKAPKCKVERMDPQPPKDTMFYQGEGKIVYERTCPNAATTHFGAAAAQAADIPAIDPAVVAAQAIDKMKLTGPQVASPRTKAKYTVGVPVWMWVTPSASTFGPNSATASAGGVTVTAKAKVSKIVWAMGDGETVTCNGPGTPFKNTRHGAESPDCGHTYQQPSTQEPGTKYSVTATAYWNVSWQANTGEAGQIPTTRETAVTFTVGELQSVGS